MVATSIDSHDASFCCLWYLETATAAVNVKQKIARHLIAVSNDSHKTNHVPSARRTDGHRCRLGRSSFAHYRTPLIATISAPSSG
jgi:hypothetical protein